MSRHVQLQPDHARVPLTRGLFALIDLDDVGRIAGWSWTANPVVRRGRTLWRACRWETGADGKRRVIHMHRAVLGVTESSVIVDHINGDGLDNRRANLRTCTNQENQRNQHTTVSSGGYKGVRFHARLKSKPYGAEIVVDGKSIYLGYFATAEEAAIAYDAAARARFGAFARCNFEREAAAL